MPSASSEATIGNETDSCRLMRRPKPPCVQEAVTAVTVQRTHSVVAARTKPICANICWPFTTWQSGAKYFFFKVFFLTGYNNIWKSTDMRKEPSACLLTEFTKTPILGQETTETTYLCLCLEVPPPGFYPAERPFSFSFSFLNFCSSVYLFIRTNPSPLPEGTSWGSLS